MESVMHKREIFEAEAEDCSDSESDAVKDNWWTKSNKKFLNMKLRYVEITVIRQQLEFYY